ncbi:MAG: hypothetical protein JWR62_2552 [Modestobacter sp.]|jgi:hypothetical protein|nr:hypothetical protein [Modestobacter sp.]HEV7872289.1 hypothetical protein [Modestobacter sp.]
MRMMLKAVIDTPAGNTVVADGSIGQLIGGLVEQLHPEAVYFAGEDGQRACFMVFDMQDAADLPSVCEPLFQGGNARVTVTPCMNLEDMQKGVSELNPAAGASAGDDAVRMSAGVG